MFIGAFCLAHALLGAYRPVYCMAFGRIRRSVNIFIKRTNMSNVKLWASSLNSRRRLVGERILCSYIPAENRKAFVEEIIQIKERATGEDLTGLLLRDFWLNETICSTLSTITFVLEREACANVIKRYSIRIPTPHDANFKSKVKRGEVIRVCYAEKTSDRPIAAQDILKTLG